MIARLLFAVLVLIPLAPIVGAALVTVGLYVAEWMTEDWSPVAEWERQRDALGRAVGA
jgi:hypothetical protein